jgi:predicted N-formylglutamate amidohydrolase
VRQDLLGDAAGIAQWTTRLAGVVEAFLQVHEATRE